MTELLQQDVELVISHLQAGTMEDINYIPLKSGYESSFVLSIATYEAVKRLLDRVVA